MSIERPNRLRRIHENFCCTMPKDRNLPDCLTPLSQHQVPLLAGRFRCVFSSRVFALAVFTVFCLQIPPAIGQEPGVVATFLNGSIGFGAAHAISGDGSRVVFESSNNITGGNADLNGELFLWDESTGFQQLTDTVNQNFYWQVDIDITGSTVAVVADADISGAGATQSELYRWSGGTWSRLTVTIGASSLVFIDGMAISDDGSKVLLTSRGDYVGMNPTGEEQVWLWDSASGFDQITNASPCGVGGGNFGSDISGDGSRILFSSRCQIGAANMDLNSDIFLYDSITGITALTNEPSAVNARGRMNADGTIAAFRSSHDLTNGGLGTATHLFRWTEGSGFEQLTTIGVANDAPSISADGGHIAFTAENGQGTGANPEMAPEIFRWQDAPREIRILTDSEQTSTFFGNEEAMIAADGARMVMLALRAFDAPLDLRTGYFVLDIGEAPVFSDGFE